MDTDTVTMSKPKKEECRKYLTACDNDCENCIKLLTFPNREEIAEGTDELLRLLDAQKVMAVFPTDKDYDLLRELFEIEDSDDLSWDLEEGKEVAVRFNNLKKLQKLLEEEPDLLKDLITRVGKE